MASIRENVSIAGIGDRKPIASGREDVHALLNSVDVVAIELEVIIFSSSSNAKV